MRAEVLTIPAHVDCLPGSRWFIAERILTRKRVFAGFVASKRTMATLRHKGRLGQDLAKILVHKIRSFKKQDPVSGHPALIRQSDFSLRKLRRASVESQFAGGVLKGFSGPDWRECFSRVLKGGSLCLVRWSTDAAARANCCCELPRSGAYCVVMRNTPQVTVEDDATVENRRKNTPQWRTRRASKPCTGAAGMTARPRRLRR